MLLLVLDAVLWRCRTLVCRTSCVLLGLAAAGFAIALPAARGPLVAQDGAGAASRQAGLEPTPQATGAAAPEYDPQLVSELAAEALEQGDALRGLAAFATDKFACLSCHKIGRHGGRVGPELTAIGKERTVEQLVESLFWPQREVKPEYVAHTLLTVDGRVLRGYKEESDDATLLIRDPSTGAVARLMESDIESQQESGTLMPDGLTAAMPQQQQRDLIRFLSELGRASSLAPEAMDAVLAHSQTHRPAGFSFDRAPLVPDDWPNWQHRVNRDRLYDFYTKQAEYFRAQQEAPSLLVAFPGLDGGEYGHWGNQHEELWADDRWNDTELGSVQCGVFRGAGVTVPRGICIRLGEGGELSACFNPDTLTYDALWSGGFVKFSSVRHGFMDGLALDGQPLPQPEGERPDAPYLYQGFYRYGRRILFRYRIGDTEYLDAPWVEDGRFTRTVAPVDSHPLQHLVSGGPPQWPQRIPAPILYGSGRPYAVDTISLPVENPWNVLVFCGDHDFLPDGSALVCTIQGDVWHVDGFLPGQPAGRSTDTNDSTRTAATARWRRFAAGLNHALGLVVAEDGIYVQGRDQITRLHDLNGDGEADYYECFSNAFTTSPAGHDFICGLQRDSQGNFYTASGNQGLVCISPDGREATAVATGLRNPDGVGLMPGLLTAPCSEGEWTPASMICAVRLDAPAPVRASAPAIGGHQPPYFGYGGPRDERPPDLPLVYLPRGLDNSSGGQVYVSSTRWGPLEGQLLHFSIGSGSHLLVLRDEVDGQLQGAVVPLVGEFLSGVHRGRFHPVDGQLYVSGMAGWVTYTPDDGCFQRVRYTGDPVKLPVGFHVYQNGVTVTFSSPLDTAVAADRRSHFAQCWNYRYSAAYGSAEFSRNHFGVPGHDVVAIRSAHVLEDGRTVFLEMPELQPVNQLHLRLTSGPSTGHDLFLTVHKLDRPFTAFPGYRPAVRQIAPHPILSDLALATRQIPNPWLQPMQAASAVTIETGSNLSFATRQFTVRAGAPIKFTLVNPDVVPHNWALVQAGALQRVGELANRMVADPEAAARHYVPDSTDVLAYTDVVPAGGEFTIYFRAPESPGRYPFLCTFPGHWMVMNGEMIVE